MCALGQEVLEVPDATRIRTGRPEVASLYRSINEPCTRHYGVTIKDLFERQAALRADSCAITLGESELSYRELNVLANGMALRLTEMGVSTGDVVAISMARSLELVVALVAVAKCGALYFPVDASWPEKLRGELIDAAACKLLLSGFPSAAAPTRECEVMGVTLADVRAIDANPETHLREDGGAYINFTSGSTGRPKGVQVGIRGVVRLVTNSRYAELSSGSSVLQMSTPTFDAATFEIWGPLLNGGRCVLYPGSHMNLGVLGSTIEDRAVNCVFLTTALFNAVLDERPEVLDSVHTILFGGEAYSHRHVASAFARYGPGRLVHMYGPTECTTFATYHPIVSAPSALATLPVGKPIQDTKLYVVSDDALCDCGEVGEVLLAGPGVAQGYIGAMPEALGRFGAVEIGGEAEWVYRTGDYGYLTRAGELVLEGRLDEQVKVNGFRVDMTQVSRVLGENDAVRQAYLALSDGVAGEKQLLAFVVPRDGRSSAARVREEIRRELPRYMVPSVIYFCDSLPLMATGKVDRNALMSRYHNLT
jgi:D-alanine--poly(phosphoribitol) ligase subunit 1